MQVGDYVDTLLLPSSGLKNATVRWVPGPGEITGVGYALLHCHISPHSDEGCIMKTQLLEQKCVSLPVHPISPPLAPHMRLTCSIQLQEWLSLYHALSGTP